MKHISKRLFAVLLAVCMLVGLAPMVSAEPAPEESGNTAEQLAASIEAGGTIKLDQDYTGDNALKRAKEPGRSAPPILTISKDVTLDLNGYALELKCGERVKDEETGRTVDNRNTYGIYLTEGATLTVTDSTATKNDEGVVTDSGRGKVFTDCYYLVGVNYDDEVGETLVLESGTMEVTSNWGNVISSLDPLSKVNVTGGTMEENGFRSGLIFTYGKLRISGGTFISTANPDTPEGISEESYGKDTVKGININKPDFWIAGGFFNCKLSIYAKGNGKVTGGYFIDDAFDGNRDKDEVFKNSGYDLVETTTDDAGVNLDIYKYKVISTENAEKYYEPGTLFVGGVKMAPASGDTEVTNEIKDDEGNVVASYDENNHTLTLTDYKNEIDWILRDRLLYSGELYDVNAGIYYKGGKDNETLTIVLKGDNSITMKMPDDTNDIIYDLSAGVCVEGANLVIESDGTGTLTATGAPGSQFLAESAGIFVEEEDTDPSSYEEYGGKLTIQNCTVEAIGNSAAGKGWYEKGDSEGIYAECDVLIENATVTARAGSAAKDSIGFVTDNNAEFNNSTVTGSTSAEERSENSYGICVYRKATITDSTIIGEAGSASRYSDGILFDSITSVSGSKVTGTSGAGEESSAGIYSDAQLTISDGSEVTGTSPLAEQGKSHGIHAKYSMLVSGGSTVKGIAGGSSNSNSIGVNVDGVLGIDGNSAVTGNADEARDGVSCGADIDSILAISEGSKLTGIGAAAKTSIGVRCGLVASEVTVPEQANEFVFYYGDYTVPEGSSQTLEGSIVARGAESDATTSYGMVLLPFIGDVEMVIPDEEIEYSREEYAEYLEWLEKDEETYPFLQFLQESYYDDSIRQVGDTFVYSTNGFVVNDKLNVTGSLLAQGVNGGLQYAELKEDTDIRYIWNSAGEVAADTYPSGRRQCREGHADQLRRRDC